MGSSSNRCLRRCVQPLFLLTFLLTHSSFFHFLGDDGTLAEYISPSDYSKYVYVQYVMGVEQLA